MLRGTGNWKDSSHRDDSFEYREQIIKLMNKKIFTTLRSIFFFFFAFRDLY